MCVCVCVCVCASKHEHGHTHTHTFAHAHTSCRYSPRSTTDRLGALPSHSSGCFVGTTQCGSPTFGGHSSPDVSSVAPASPSSTYGEGAHAQMFWGVIMKVMSFGSAERIDVVSSYTHTHTHTHTTSHTTSHTHTHTHTHTKIIKVVVGVEDQQLEGMQPPTNNLPQHVDRARSSNPCLHSLKL